MIRVLRGPRGRGGSLGSLAIEYAVFIAVMAAALVGMAVYSMRALSGRWRDVGDAFGHGRQYEPGVGGTVCTGHCP